jgi:16S rRNA (cytosine967-C5)-methyltransferase
LANAEKKSYRKLSVRSAAARVLLGVFNGQSLTRLLEQYSAQVPDKERALLAELSYGSCRWYHRLDFYLQRLMKKPLRARDRDIHALLVIGLYQLAFMRIKPHAAVQETVNAVRLLGKPAFVKLVNGVLRSFQREQENLSKQVGENLQAQYVMPEWLMQQLKSDWPEDWSSIAKALLEQPPMTIRINTGKCTVADYVTELAEQGVTVKPVKGVNTALVLDKAVPVGFLPGFFEGHSSVQDAGAQLAAILLAADGQVDVLDACAAPGGKTGHMLEQAKEIRMAAIDVDAGRLAKVDENLQRLGFQAELFVGDAAEPAGEWAERKYDYILLDVPCSASGVIRRHPDIKLLRRKQDIGQLVKLQRRILSSIWPMLKPGGRLLYATCSLFRVENEEQIKWFLSQQNTAMELKTQTTVKSISGKHGIQLLPGISATDGFYYALLQKKTDD